MQDRSVHAEFLCRTAHGEMPGADYVRRLESGARAPQAPSGRTHPREACPHPLRNSRPLKFGDGAEDVHLELSCGRGRVDALGEADERHAKDLRFFEQRDQVFEIAPEPIQPPAEEHIELPSQRVLEQRVEGGASVLCSATP